MWYQNQTECFRNTCSLRSVTRSFRSSSRPSGTPSSRKPSSLFQQIAPFEKPHSPIFFCSFRGPQLCDRVRRTYCATIHPPSPRCRWPRWLLAAAEACSHAWMPGDCSQQRLIGKADASARLFWGLVLRDLRRGYKGCAAWSRSAAASCGPGS